MSIAAHREAAKAPDWCFCLFLLHDGGPQAYHQPWVICGNEKVAKAKLERAVRQCEEWLVSEGDPGMKVVDSHLVQNYRPELCERLIEEGHVTL
jgi:hypothetical protein